MSYQLTLLRNVFSSTRSTRKCARLPSTKKIKRMTLTITAQMGVTPQVNSTKNSDTGRSRTALFLG